MPNPTIHPNGDIANFVNNYESRIKPYLNRGKIPEGIRSIVMEHHMRYEIMDNLPIKPNGAAKAYHRLALNFLLRCSGAFAMYFLCFLGCLLAFHDLENFCFILVYNASDFSHTWPSL